ncbi:MAG: N-acetylglucosamine-6-phosphate deacetylase [Fusobacteriaceae bacterium]|jgi:N-acetylglucosamine-6-phosphate deacetylase|nr:N-acetylglucosamine-6-phosphate deacetylase [Fusobacteriaceae bacterium]
MKSLLLKNGNIFLKNENFIGDILIENGIIKKIEKNITEKTEDVIEVHNQKIIPGFIDIHIHGANGADTMDNSVSSLKKISSFIVKHGVTNFLPTTLTSSKDILVGILEKIAGLQDAPMPGANIFGVHMEGPYFDIEYKGGQNEKYIKVSTIEEIKKFLTVKNRLVKLFSISPNNDAAIDSIKYLKNNGVIVSIGHSACVYEKVKRGIEAGITHATHTYNGMRGFSHREPGVVGAIFEADNVMAEVIFDKIHVHPTAVDILIKIKGVNNIICITDAMSATGLKDGDYKLGELDVYLKNGEARLKINDSLAGSVLTMDKVFRNLLELGYSIFDSIKMTSSNAASEFDLNVGEIAIGKQGDLIVLDESSEVLLSIIKGEVKYKKE